MEKKYEKQIIMEKNGLICSNPLISQEEIIMKYHEKFWVLPRIMENMLKSHPANVEPLRGKANYGKTETGITCLS